MTNQLTNIDLINFSGNAYGDADSLRDYSVPDGYQKLDIPISTTDAKEGFQAAAYYNQTTNKLVIAYAGTNSFSDLDDASGFVTGANIDQARLADSFYNSALDKVQTQYSTTITTSDITLTGHSLGGGLAAMIGILKDVAATVFNAPQVGRQLDNIEKMDDKPNEQIGRQLDNIEKMDDKPNEQTGQMDEGAIKKGILTSQDPTTFKVTNISLDSDGVHLAGNPIGQNIEVEDKGSIFGTVLYAIAGAAGAALITNPIGAVGGVVAGLLGKFVGTSLSGSHFLGTLKEAKQNQESTASGEQTTVQKFLNAVGSVDAYINKGISSVVKLIDDGINWMSSGHVISDLTGTAKDAWNSTVSFFDGLFDGHSGAAPTNSDGTVNFNLINNTNLDLDIRTDKLQGFLGNQDTTQTGNVIGDGDWEVKMPINIINGDGYKNVAQSGIVSDFFRPGNQELSSYSNFNTDLKLDFGYLNNLVSQINSDPFNQKLNFQLQSPLAEITNNTIGARSFLNIDPVVLDLNGDGVKLTSYNTSEVTFDVDNDGKRERTGWVSNQDGILVEDQNNNGKIDNITETISEYYKLQGSNWTKDADGKYSSDGLSALKKLDSNNDGKFNSSDAKWNDLRVWVDTNGDAATDVGELKTLTEAGVKEINLADITQANKERNEGNIIFSKTNYTTTTGQIKQVAAVDFTTNPIGYEFNDVNLGKLATAEDGTKSLVIKNENGETVVAGNDTAQNIFGNIGNDNITGDDRDNWISGGKGSDILKGGKGDDILIIDSQDKQENIDGGEGRDIAIIDSDKGITFNLTESNIETAVGGNGDDVLIGGGTSNVFIDGGSGDDVIIGGAADDALSGSDGNDYLDGGFGDDIMRGHKGNDILIGGEGNDYLEGGLDDDKIFADKGNDVIMEGAGNDEIDGGDGYDLVKYQGSYKDYKISRDSNNYKIQDLKTGNIDSIKNIEGVRFADVTIKLVDGNISPLPVADLITLSNKTDTVFIPKADLLKNDLDIDGDVLTIISVQNSVGGSARLVKSNTGEVLGVEFTPSSGFIGNMSFDYDVKDSKGAYTIIEQRNNDGASVTAAMKARVTFKLASDPTDDLYAKQWYLSEINVQKAWEDYTGQGIKIGVFEKGDFNINHQELNDNTLQSYKDDVAFREVDQFAQHKTTVAGVIAAEKNGTGIVGVAYNSKLDGYSWDRDETGLANLKSVDIANNSWSAVGQFADNFSDANNPYVSAESMLEDAAKLGRAGLGTISVFAGGNSRAEGDNVNYHNFQNSRFVITTGSINQPGDLATLTEASTPFSNPGDAILVSAPGSNINSTGNLLTNENGSQFLGEFSSSQGTSFSAPIVSGVVALMLQANPNLGYRDVQKILALSARQFNDPNTTWQENGAENWNGGAMHFSHDYGFGIVDADAAVRLAETWDKQSTYYNEKFLSAENKEAILIPDNQTVGKQFAITSSGMHNIETVEVEVNLSHLSLSDLTIKLVSPSGTESILLDKPTNSVYSGGLVFNFSSRAFLGENVDGDWKLLITDSKTGDVGYLNSWKLKFYGELDDGKNDLYVYTDEFAKLTDGSRGIISDADGGTDTINASAISTDTTINLNAGKISKIAGHDVLISGGTPGDEYYQKKALLPTKEAELVAKNSELAAKNQTLNAKQTELAGIDSTIGSKVSEINQKVSEANAAAQVVTDHWVNKNPLWYTYKEGGSTVYVFKNSSGQQTALYNNDGKQRIDNYNAAISVKNQKISEYNTLKAQYDDLVVKRESLPAEIGSLSNEVGALSNQATSLTSEINFIKAYLNSFNESGASSIENAYTGDGNDTIIGSGLANEIWGGRGHNILTGNGGTDTFIIKKNAATVDTITDFKAGEDKIDLSNFGSISISDLIITQNGANAEIKFASGQKIILQNLNAGSILTDNFLGIAEVKNAINGTDTTDTLLGTANGDLIKAKAGLDIVNAYAGNDEIDGGAGNDMLYGGAGDDVIYGSDGDDSIYGDGDLNMQTYNVDNWDNRNGNNKLFGGAGNDNILGGSGKDYIDGGTGDDQIFGGAGDDVIIGGDGNNQIQGGTGSDVIDLGTGIETLVGTTQMNVAFGEAGSDRFVISDKFIGSKHKYDVIGDFDVNDPNEKIDLSRVKGVNKYSDLTINQYGTDTYITFNTSAFGYSQVIKLQNVDASKLTASKFIITNEAPHAASDSALTSEDKSVTINVTANDSDDKTDAANAKIIVVQPTNGTVTVNYNGTVTYTPKANFNGIDQFEYQLTDAGGLTSEKVKVIVNIDPVNDAPIVTKVISDQIFYSSKGINFKADDIFKEVDGEAITYAVSLLDGSPLPSWINFDSSSLSFSGTAPTTDGIFTIKFTATDQSGNSTSTNIKLTIDNSITVGTEGDDNIAGTSTSDTIDGNKGNDVINGGDGNDLIFGGEGNDQLSSGWGSDRLYGEAGNDILKGDVGNQILDGGDGNDTLYSLGSGGNDTLTGGLGSDTFVIGNDIISNDIITDFDVSDPNEKIDLSNFVPLKHGFSTVNIISDLGITQVGNDTKITFSNSSKTVTVKNVKVSDLTADKFILNNAPTVSSTISDQKVYITKNFNLNFSNSFSDADNNITSYAATLADGSPLPDWLHFDSTTGNLSGQAPNSASALSIKLTAIDKYGFTASTNFKFAVDDKIIFGTDGNDTITGTSASEMIEGGKGNDVINGGNGDDLIFGGEGNDQLSSGWGSDKLYGEAGDDILRGDVYSQILDGGDGNDKLYSSGSGSGDTLIGGAGSDTFVIGNDIISNDIITDFNVNDPNEKIDLSALKDVATDFSQLVIEQVGSDAKISFTSKSKTILIKNVAKEQLTVSKFIGLTDNKNSLDSLTINGNSNNETLVGGSGSDIINGAGGNDTIKGGLGSNLLTGGTGDDIFVISKNPGKTDVITDFEAFDGFQFDGFTVGAKLSNFSYTEEANTVTFNLGDGQSVVFQNIKAADLLHYLSFSSTTSVNSSYTGTAGNDKIMLSANYANVALNGGDGDDLISGKGWHDLINGGKGNDVLRGGQGYDIFEINKNSSDKDTIVDLESYDSIVLKGFANNNLASYQAVQSNNDTVIDLGDGQTLTLKNFNVENFPYIPSYTNRIIFDSGSTTLTGTDVSDLMVGYSGQYGGGLSGGKGNDTLYGGSGNDTISGGSGNNILIGGSGSDTFVVKNSNLSSVDTVMDFSSATDKINLSEFNINSFADLIISEQDGNAVIEISDINKVVLKGINYSDLTENNFVGFKTKIGTDGNDTIDNNMYLNSYSTIHAGAGNDSISSYSFYSPSYMPPSNDVSGNSYEYYGEDGNDEFGVYGNGKFKLDGGNGDDYFSAGVKDSKLYGGSGSDIMRVNIIKSSDQSNNVTIFGGNNEVYGGDGDDVLWVESGSDNNVLSGGSGKDQFIIEKFAAGTTSITDFEVADEINLALCDFDKFEDLQILQNGPDSIINLGENQSLVLKNFNSSLLTADNFVFRVNGDANDNIIEPNNDYLNVVKADGGNDVLISGAGDNELTGGLGDDLFLIKNSPDSWTNITDFDLSNPNEKIQISGFVGIKQFSDLNIHYTYGLPSGYGIADYASVYFSNGQAIRISNVANNSLTASNFIFNSIPKANLTSFTTNEDSSTLIDVLSQATDVDGDLLSISAITNPSHGTIAVVLDEQGKQKISYTPEANFSGNDKFNYTVSDGKGGIDTKTISITVNEVNDAPVFETVTQISYQEIKANSYTNNSQQQPSVAALSDGGWISTWESNGQDGWDNGIYAQRYSGDGQAVGNEFKVNSYIAYSQRNPSITKLNDGGFIIVWESQNKNNFPGIISAQRYSSDGQKVGSEFDVSETRQVQTIDSTGFNKTNGNCYSPSVVTLKDGGWVIVYHSYNFESGYSNGIYGQRYSSDGQKFGEEFRVNTYTTNDQKLASTAALGDGGWIVSWQSYGQDGSENGVYAQRYSSDGNVAGNEFKVNTYTTNSQSSPSITTLKDGGWIISWQSDGQDGSLSGVYAQHYSSDGQVVGNEFRANSYTNSDQTYPSITALNDGGWLISWTSSVQDGSGYGIYAQRYSSDGQPIGDEFRVNSYTDSYQMNPSVTVLNDGGWVISWQSSGQDGSSYGIYSQRYFPDGTTTKIITTTSLTKTTTLAIDEDASSNPSSIGVIDHDGDALTYSLKEGFLPQKGTVIFDQVAGTYSYIPNPNQNGSDNFTILISDGKGGVAELVVNTTIKPINDAPIATATNLVANEDSSAIIDVLSSASDVDNDILSISAVTAASHGVASIIIEQGKQKVSYTPSANFNGTDQFNYTISDGKGGFVTKTLNITVNPINDNPIATVNSAVVDEDNSITIDVLASASDADLDQLSIAGVYGVINGVANIVDGKIVYTPNANYNGNTSFNYTISDGNGGLVTKTLNITVNAVNDAPIATISSAQTNEDTKLVIDVLSSASDADSDSLTLSLIGNPANGIASIIDVTTTDSNGNQITTKQIEYNPNANWNGSDSIVYQLSDGKGGVITKTLNITVNAVNDAPVTTNDNVSLSEDNSVKISTLANDSDVEDGSFEKNNIAIIAAALHGTVVLNDDLSFTYTPDNDYFGTDSFSYQVKDKDGASSNTANVYLDIASVNDAPTIDGIAESQNLAAGKFFSYDLSKLDFSDADGDTVNVYVKLADGSNIPSWLTFDNTSKILSGTPGTSDAGSLSLQLIASDGSEQTIQKFEISITKPIVQNTAIDVNVITVSAANETISANEGVADILEGNNSGNNLQYAKDDIWVGTNYVAWNPYSNDTVQVTGMNRSFDAFDGGDGNDTLDLTANNDAVFLDDMISKNPSAQGNRLFGVETIDGGGGNDIIDLSSNRFAYGDATLNGGNGNDVLWGNDGNDTLNGGTGDDNLQGGRGNDTLSGGGGNDIIKGYHGNDLMIGGKGADVMIGGVGNDQFIFTDLADSTDSETDIILDFIRGEDKINLSSLGFDSVTEGQGSNSSAHGIEYHFEGGNTIIDDPNSNFAVKLAGEIHLDHNDFAF